MLASVLLSTLLMGASPSGKANSCDHNNDAMMRLDYLQFDQDTSNGGGGWRKFDTPQCRLVAASLIAMYRSTHSGLMGSQKATLNWHEGQMRALSGQTSLAIPLMERSKYPVQYDKAGWNAYVDGTIAFLSKDKNRLIAARDSLKEVPPVDEIKVVDGKAKIRFDNGQLMDVEWPPNLGILNGFISCFDRPYSVAYLPPMQGNESTGLAIQLVVQADTKNVVGFNFDREQRHLA